jgi:hypothetical protein
MQTVFPSTVWQLAAPGPTQVTLPLNDRQRRASAEAEAPRNATTKAAAAGVRREAFGMKILLSSVVVTRIELHLVDGHGALRRKGASFSGRFG